MVVRLEVINNYDDLLGIKDQWRRLFESLETKSLPLTHEWICNWWRCFGKNANLRIYLIFDQSKLLAIAPFIKRQEKYRGINVAVTRLMANGHSPFCDFLVDSSASAEQRNQIMQLILDAQDSDILSFSKVPDTGLAWEFIQKNSNVKNKKIGIKDNLLTPILHIAGSWEDYFRSRSKKLRKSINNKVNRYSKEKDFSIECREITTDDLSIIDEITEISKASWKRELGTDLGSNPASKNFLLGLIEEFGKTGATKIWLMRKAGAPVAFEFHLTFNGVVYPLRADFNETYREYSPGSILEYSALKSLFEEQSARIYDSCANDYWYLSNWTDVYRRQYDIEVFSRSLKSRLLYRLEYQMIPLYRRWFRKT